MGSLENLVAALDELEIARNVTNPHDEARMDYALSKNTVGDFEEFTDVIAEYFNYHFSRCVVPGGAMSRTEAAGRAKEILVQEYGKQGGNIITGYNDAHHGTNGGLRVILDKIAEQLKKESVERYIRDAFDRYVTPNSWEQKLDIIRQFIARYGPELSSSIRADQPERYAQNYEELIRAFIDYLKNIASRYRRF
jgi:hypothetical protein